MTGLHGVPSAMRHGLLTLCVLSTGCRCCSCPPGPPDASPPDLQPCALPNGDAPDGGYVLNQLKLSPAALFDDEFAGTPVELTVCASGAADLQLHATFFQHWFDGAGAGITDVVLDDRGVDGRCGAARSFTASIAASQTPRLRYGGGTLDALPIGVNATDASGKNVSPAVPISSQVYLGVVARAEQVGSSALAGDVIAAPNMVNVVVQPGQCEGEHELGVAAMHRVYAFYPDVFDGFALYEYGLSTTDNIPRGGPIKNVVSGINLNLFDGSAEYGSDGALHMATWIHTDVLGISQLHEIGHSYNFYYADPSLDLTRGGGHGVHVGSPTSLIGLMGGTYVLQPQADGSLLVAAPAITDFNARQYAFLELHDMGLVPASMVPADWYVFDPLIDTTQSKPGDVIPKTSATLVSIADIERVYGVRSPDASASQKSFRFVFIGVSERPMTAAEIALLDRLAGYYAGTDPSSVDDRGLFATHSPASFAWATRGFGTLVTALPPVK